MIDCLTAKTEEEFLSFWSSNPKHQIIVKEKKKEKTIYDFEEKYNHTGIYCICIDNKVLYIGKSVNMFERIKNHIDEISKRIPNEKKYRILKEAKD